MAPTTYRKKSPVKETVKQQNNTKLQKKGKKHGNIYILRAFGPADILAPLRGDPRWTGGSLWGETVTEHWANGGKDPTRQVVQGVPWFFPRLCPARFFFFVKYIISLRWQHGRRKQVFFI